jgi:hypothetical protein
MSIHKVNTHMSTNLLETNLHEQQAIAFMAQTWRMFLMQDMTADRQGNSPKPYAFCTLPPERVINKNASPCDSLQPSYGGRHGLIRLQTN